MAQSMTVMDFLFFKSRQTAQQEGSRARPLRPRCQRCTAISQRSGESCGWPDMANTVRAPTWK